MNKNRKHNYIINTWIKSPNIRVVGSEQYDGVYTLSEALALSRSEGLDLIEIKNQYDTSICKLMEFSKFQYQEKQKKKEQKKNNKGGELKEIRLGVEISENDISYRIKNAIDFLSDGNKVKCVIQFRGRQIVHKERGEIVLLSFADQCKDNGLLEYMPKLEGKKMHIIIKPK